MYPYLELERCVVMYLKQDEIGYVHDSEDKVKDKILTILSYEEFTLSTTKHLFDKIIEEIKAKNKINL